MGMRLICMRMRLILGVEYGNETTLRLGAWERDFSDTAVNLRA